MQVQGKYGAKTFLTEKTFPTAKTFLTEQMTRAQGLRLKRLSEEAYQPAQYARDLSSSEAARRVQVLEAEIELADSF